MGRLADGLPPKVDRLEGGLCEAAAMGPCNAPPDAMRQFGCPRCATVVTEPWYGPCVSCREELRRAVRGTPAEVTAAAYEPKMNVTPNAVAMKE
jgi:hypothetical protein